MTQPYAKLRVLIADSSGHMATLIAQMLRALNIRATTEVSDVTAAAAALARQPFDVVMIDDQLGTVDSVELVRKLRASESSPNRSTAIIMMSSAPSAPRIAAARDAGITEFLRKPFAAQHIESRLDNILGKPRDFIASDAYAGPDRRRRSGPATAARRASDKAS